MPTLQTLRENIRSTRQIVRNDLADKLANRRNPKPVQLDARQEKALADLRRDGYAVVENYWDRDRALAMRDRLEAFLADGVDKDFDEGAWLRFWDNHAYDQGVRRLYHVEKVVPELHEVRHDPFVLDIAQAY